MQLIINILGILTLLGVLYLISAHRKSINFKMILKALIVQFVIGFLLVKFPFGRILIGKVSDVVTKILSYGNEGISFLFGSLGDSTAPTGMIFAIQVLGNIIFISALVAALYYLGILGFIVEKIGFVIGKIFGTSNVESFVAVANMFLGQTDSPILVSKYLNKMTDSETMLVLISGMGSMSVSIIMGYTALGIPMEYLLIASTMVPVTSILVSKLILPQTEVISEVKAVKMDNKGEHKNLISAISQGAMEGMNMAMAVGASLIAIISLVALVNGALSIFGITLEQVFSYIFAPIGFFMGIGTENVLFAGELLGSKFVLNEFIAFGNLGKVMSTLDPRTGMMLAISLSGFANISSMGICVSGIAVLCPEKRDTLAKLAFRALIGGFCVSVLNALIIGIILF